MDTSPPDPIRVLLIEDCPGDVFLIREMVQESKSPRFRMVAQTDRLEPGIALMRAGGIDVVLLDLTLPDSHGIESFTRAHEAVPELPIVVLSGIDDEEFAAQALHLGAQEYLVKGRMDMHLLQRALRYAIERSRSEAQLGRERELLHTLLDNIPDRIYFKDEQSRFIRINHALMRLFNLERPEDAYGKTDTDFYEGDHASEALKDEQRVMETGEPLFNKIEYETLFDGTRAWSLTTKLPLRDRAGRIVGTCGISREITDLKEMEVRLASERNLLRSVIDNLPDSIFLKDTEGRYLLDNVAHFRGLGASEASEVLGRTVFDFFPDELAEQFHHDDLAIIRNGQALLNHEERTFDVHGNARWLLTTKVPWRDEEGETLGVLCIARDITEQKEAQENLRKAYAELAHSREEVLEAMGKLQSAHQQLREVQLQFVEAEKMKSIGRLAAGVAHEVKNPLAVIKMGVDFLAQQDQGDDTSHLILKEMADAVQRADTVISGMLDYSRPKQLEVQRVDLNAIITQALKLVRGEMKPGTRIVRELQADMPTLALDGGKISQVFINLMTNALHAMDDGGTLSVRTYSKQLTGVGSNVGDSRAGSLRVGGQIVVAEIDDTGHGIPEEKLGKIFEPFFTTKPTGKGTGLGLSVVKTIVDLHGATIDIRNLPEGGTRATIMFQV
jgi:PAS domain S-box-containing protein